jgi:hypothetical protein
MSFIYPKKEYASKQHNGCKHGKYAYCKHNHYGFNHMDRAIIAPRIAPSMQAPKNSFMSISYFTRY